MQQNTLIGIIAGAGLALMLALTPKKALSLATTAKAHGKSHKSNIHKGNPAHHFHGPASQHNKKQVIQDSELLSPSQQTAKDKAQTARDFTLKHHGQTSAIIRNPSPSQVHIKGNIFHGEGDIPLKKSLNFNEFEHQGTGFAPNDPSPLQTNQTNANKFVIGHGDIHLKSLESDPTFPIKLST